MIPTQTPPLEHARAAYLSGDPTAARRILEAQPEFDLESAAFLSLCWVRQILSDRPHGACVDVPILQAALAAPFAIPRFEAERQFALGWLHWLAGESPQAEAHLTTAVNSLVAEKAAAEAAYWLARVRLALGREETVAEFEKVMRLLPATPQLTCWFVDLLGRAGQIERAEGVWKTVRGNRRVLACDEAPLLEARPYLRRGEVAMAERLLNEAQPRGGVVQVERWLLLAWIAATLNRTSQAVDLFHQAEGGPYPTAVLQTWQRLFALRSGSPDVAAIWPDAEGAGRAWVAGQRARADGRAADAVAALRSAATVRAFEPFARYALACLQEDDHDTILAGQPGLFVALRCRAQRAVQRFGRREISPAELLDALQQAETAAYAPCGADHFQRLALTLKQRNPHVDDLRRLVASAPAGTPVARNLLRAAVEVAMHGLPPTEAILLLKEWMTQGRLQDDPSLRAMANRQVMRLLLLGGGQVAPDRLFLSEESQASDPLRDLVWALTGVPNVLPRTSEEDNAEAPLLIRLWQAAGALHRGDEDAVRSLFAGISPRDPPRARGLVQALLTYAAARRGDAAALAGLLEEVTSWQGFAPAPPRFVLQALAWVVSSPSVLARCRAPLGSWLSLWDREALGPEGRTLATAVEITPREAARDGPPPHVAAGPWFLHQAAQALLREDAWEALAWVRRAQAVDTELTADAPTATALEELERLARAHLLAEVIRVDPQQRSTPARVLTGMLACLESVHDGAGILATAERGDLAGARAGLAALAEAEPLPASLAHHLAIVYHRAATFFDGCERPDDATAAWRLAGRCWQRVLGAEARSDHPLLAHLLAEHRRRLSALLARDDVAAAKRRWEAVRLLGEEPTTRLQEELTTEALAAARDAARCGTIPEGWRADHEQGLAYLARALCLDTDNVRLLAALVEACNEYFLDCYNTEDVNRLWQGIERYTPYSLRLARLTETRSGDLLIRAALAEFTKFRGFIASEPARKAALFRLALQFDPANANVRDLLAEVERPREVSR